VRISGAARRYLSAAIQIAGCFLVVTVSGLLVILLLLFVFAFKNAFSWDSALVLGIPVLTFILAARVIPRLRWMRSRDPTSSDSNAVSSGSFDGVLLCVCAYLAGASSGFLAAVGIDYVCGYPHTVRFRGRRVFLRGT
jgi:hypothetical protein